MASSPGKSSSPRKDRFSWYEKLIARACLAGAILTAVVSIYLESKSAAVGYVVLVVLGSALVIYDSLCVYCPYPFAYSDCLFFPYQLVARFAKLRAGAIHWARICATALVFAAIFALPQFWLWGHWGLFAIFWGLTLPLAWLVPLHLCPRCRHERCPLNRALSPAYRSQHRREDAEPFKPACTPSGGKECNGSRQ
jgi:hypothetical protein